jgi:hypothetical protein
MRPKKGEQERKFGNDDAADGRHCNLGGNIRIRRWGLAMSESTMQLGAESRDGSVASHNSRFPKKLRGLASAA